MPEAFIPWQAAQLASNKDLPLAAKVDSSGSVISSTTDRRGPAKDIIPNNTAAAAIAAAPRANLALRDHACIIIRELAYNWYLSQQYNKRALCFQP